MAGLTTPESVATLDARFPTTGGTDFVAYSTDGTTEAAIVARTAIGATGWAAATSADPSIKANANALTSAAATGSGTITHYGVFSAATGGTQRVDWTAVSTPKPVTAGDQVQWAAGALKITLT